MEVSLANGYLGGSLICLLVGSPEIWEKVRLYSIDFSQTQN
jgi:hypothetical protein